jgi:hypothetical protein
VDNAPAAVPVPPLSDAPVEEKPDDLIMLELD